MHLLQDDAGSFRKVFCIHQGESTRPLTSYGHQAGLADSRMTCLLLSIYTSMHVYVIYTYKNGLTLTSIHIYIQLDSERERETYATKKREERTAAERRIPHISIQA